MKTVVALDDGIQWLGFKIDGIEFEVEAFDALDMLAENDLRHRTDPAFCPKCQKSFSVSDDDWGKVQATCPTCSNKCSQPKEFLDGISEILQKRFGLKRCSRTIASNFYNAVLEATEEVKKNTQERLKSPTLIESTQADSEQANNEPI